MSNLKVGEARPTQLIFTFGVGALIDLPNLSTLVMGLEDWNELACSEITEERLLSAVKKQLGNQVKKLCLPPFDNDDGSFRRANEVSLGVPVGIFPRWMRCPICGLLSHADSGLFELKEDLYRPDRTHYEHSGCSRARGRNPQVLPVRFLTVCPNGHLDEFPWIHFAHRGTPCRAPLLHMYEDGVTGEAADIAVKCECGATRRMSDAIGADAAQNLLPCRGRHPHLRDFDRKPCTEPTRTISLGASNTWFPLMLSAMALPMAPDRLGNLVDSHWAQLQHAVSVEVLHAFRQAGMLPALATYADAEIWDAIELKRNTAEEEPEEGNADLKTPEWEAFTNSKPEQVNDDFRVRVVKNPNGFEPYFEKIVLVDRLREVRALVGFTRIASPNDFADIQEITEDRRAPLTRRPPTWIPSSEVRGEGIFLQFKEDLVAKWCAIDVVKAREKQFFTAHCQSRHIRKVKPEDGNFPGIRFVLLHSFAHALMRQLSLECGYTAASIRERIYSSGPKEPGGAMAGILLYTAAPDSEGTLGGLVGLGEPEQLGRHIAQALEDMRLCASDPLCSEHFPTSTEPITLHGAACHACQFSPETSCERGNRYLDRSVLVRTFVDQGLSFFTP